MLETKFGDDSLVTPSPYLSAGDGKEKLRYETLIGKTSK